MWFVLQFRSRVGLDPGASDSCVPGGTLQRLPLPSPARAGPGAPRTVSLLSSNTACTITNSQSYNHWQMTSLKNTDLITSCQLKILQCLLLLKNVPLSQPDTGEALQSDFNTVLEHCFPQPPILQPNWSTLRVSNMLEAFPCIPLHRIWLLGMGSLPLKMLSFFSFINSKILMYEQRIRDYARHGGGGTSKLDRKDPFLWDLRIYLVLKVQDKCHTLCKISPSW